MLNNREVTSAFQIAVELPVLYDYIYERVSRLLQCKAGGTLWAHYSGQNLK